MAKRQLYAPGTRRSMVVGGLIIITSWLLIRLFFWNSLNDGTPEANLWSGRLTGLLFLGVVIMIGAMFIKEKKSKKGISKKETKK